MNTYSPDYPSGYFSFSTGSRACPASWTPATPSPASCSATPTPAVSASSLRPPTSGAVPPISCSAISTKPRKGLNLSFYAGINRYTPRTEKYDRQSTVDLNAINPENGRPGALVFAGIGGYGRTFYPVALQRDPSMSLAWNPRGDTKTVLRLSFGRSYRRSRDLLRPYGARRL